MILCCDSLVSNTFGIDRFLLWMQNAVAIGAYFSKSIMDVATLEGADFTDAQFPDKIIPQLCERDDVKGTNPTTGADTKESLMCP
jgi:hypothetical protein